MGVSSSKNSNKHYEKTSMRTHKVMVLNQYRQWLSYNYWRNSEKNYKPFRKSTVMEMAKREWEKKHKKISIFKNRNSKYRINETRNKVIYSQIRAIKNYNSRKRI